MARRPEVLAFCLGWAGQKIVWLEELALDELAEVDILEDGNSDCWNVALSEVCRLASICDGWYRHTREPFSRKLGNQLRELFQWFGGAGFKCNTVKLRVEREAEDELDDPLTTLRRLAGDGHDFYRGCFWPDFSDSREQSNERFVLKAGVLCDFIYGVSRQVGRAQEMRLGATASGFRHNTFTRMLIEDLPQVLSEIVEEKLLPESAVGGLVPPRPYSLKAPREPVLRAHEIDEFRNNFDLVARICSMAGIDPPPAEWPGLSRPSEEALALVFAAPSTKTTPAEVKSDDRLGAKRLRRPLRGSRS
jgi:hypothetical protein